MHYAYTELHQIEKAVLKTRLQITAMPTSECREDDDRRKVSTSTPSWD